VKYSRLGRVAVPPTNSAIVFVAALGHPYGANDERGVYRTTNGGQSWEKVFFSSTIIPERCSLNSTRRTRIRDR